MKLIICTLALISMSSWAAPTDKKMAKPVEKTPNVQVIKGLPGEVKAEEDCDDKAKKKVEIKPEGLSLSNNTAGCSLDEAK